MTTTEKQVRVRFTSDGRELRAEVKNLGADFDREFTRIDAKTKSASASAAVFTQDLNRETAAFQSLKASIDPAYASQLRYESVVEASERAVRKGIATQEEANRVISMAGRQHSTAMKTMGDTSRVANFHSANLFAQMNDIAVMTASGQSPLLLAAQQGSQVVQVFQQIGGGTKALRAVGSAALAMVNPVSLATLAVIAGGAAITQWAVGALSAEEDTEALTEAIQKLREETERYSARSTLFFSSAGSTVEVQVLNGIQNQMETIAQLEEELARLGNGRRDAESRELTTRRLEAAREELQVMRDQLAAYRNQRELAEQVKNIEEARTREREQFAQLEEQRARARASAQTVLSELEAQARLNELIAFYGEDNIRVTIARLEVERELFIQQTKARDISFLMKNDLIAAWDAANGIAGVDIAGNIIFARNAAGELLSNLDASARLMAITAGGPDAVNRAMMNRLYTPPEGTFTRPPVSAPSSGDGDNEALSRRKELERERDQILESLKSEQDRYNESLAQADRLTKAGLLTQKQYVAHVQQLSEEFRNAEFSAVISEIEEISSSLVDAVIDGENLGDVFGQVIRRMASDLASSGLNQLIAELFVPTASSNGLLGGLIGFDPFAGISFDGGGYTGNAPRSGGLDGRGGFLAMLHPQEVVLDQTRPSQKLSGQTGGVMRLEIHSDPSVMVGIAENTTGMMISRSETRQARALPGQVNAVNSRRDGRVRS